MLGDGAEMLRALARHDGEQQLYFSELIRDFYAREGSEQGVGVLRKSGASGRKPKPALPSKAGLPQEVMQAATLARSNSGGRKHVRSWKAASASLRSSGRSSGGRTRSPATGNSLSPTAAHERSLSRSNSFDPKISDARALAKSSPGGEAAKKAAEAAAKEAELATRELSVSMPAASVPSSTLDHARGDAVRSDSPVPPPPPAASQPAPLTPPPMRSLSPAIRVTAPPPQASPRHSEFAALDLERNKSDIVLRRKTMSPLMALDLSGADEHNKVTFFFVSCLNLL